MFKRPFPKKVEKCLDDAREQLIEHDMLAAYHNQMAEYLRLKIKYLQTKGWEIPSTKLLSNKAEE